MSRLLDQIPKPHASEVNTGASPCKAATLRKWLGEPRIHRDYNATGKSPDNPRLLKNLRLATIGKFRVTCLTHLADRLETAYRTILTKSVNPALTEAEREDWRNLAEGLGTAGALNCRWVRGSTTTLSNHSWGSAIDFTFKGVLDTRGDNMVYRWEMLLYSVLKSQGIFWGVEFPTEDGMHFELSDETVDHIGRTNGFKGE